MTHRTMSEHSTSELRPARNLYNFIFQDMSSFKMAALQKSLEESVPSCDLDKVNRQYHELTEKYRDLLEKGNTLVSKAEAVVGLQVRQPDRSIYLLLLCLTWECMLTWFLYY